LIAQQATDQDLTGSNRGSHLSSDNNHEQSHPLVGLFPHQSQQMSNSISTGPVSTGTSVSNNNNNQSQATGLNGSKGIGGMGSTLDRTAFRQQPPPMKVKFRTKDEGRIDPDVV
jgi:hypothetical protein